MSAVMCAPSALPHASSSAISAPLRTAPAPHTPAPGKHECARRVRRTRLEAEVRFELRCGVQREEDCTEGGRARHTALAQPAKHACGQVPERIVVVCLCLDVLRLGSNALEGGGEKVETAEYVGRVRHVTPELRTSAPQASVRADTLVMQRTEHTTARLHAFTAHLLRWQPDLAIAGGRAVHLESVRKREPARA
jgi:hypothetical protein